MPLYLKLGIVDIDASNVPPENIVYEINVPLGDSLPPSIKTALNEAACRSMDESAELQPAMILALMGLLGTKMIGKVVSDIRGE